MAMDMFKELFAGDKPMIYVDGYGASDAGDKVKANIIIMRRYADGRITIAEYEAEIA